MKKLRIAAIALAVVMVLGAAGCGGDKAESKKESSNTSSESMAEEIEKENKSSSGSGDSKYDNFESSDTFATMEKILKENMDGFDTELVYDKDSRILFLNITAPEGTASVVADGLTGDVKTAWDNMINSFLNLTQTGKETLESAGYEDMGFALMFISDENAENTLYSAVNGEEFYNVANE